MVVGCGMFGASLALALSASGHDVIVMDMQEDAFDQLGDDFDGETITEEARSCCKDAEPTAYPTW